MYQREIKGTELNIAILVTLLSSVPFITIINPVPFISEELKDESPTIKDVEKLKEEAKVNKDKTFDAKSINTKEYYQKQIDWLNERFPNGKYEDVIGLCKVAKLYGEDGIIDQDYSLNAGRYVGVVIEDDGMTEDEFKEKILSLNKEFNELSAEVAELEKEINCDINQLFKK